MGYEIQKGKGVQALVREEIARENWGGLGLLRANETQKKILSGEV